MVEVAISKPIKSLAFVSDKYSNAFSNHPESYFEQSTKNKCGSCLMQTLNENLKDAGDGF